MERAERERKGREGKRVGIKEMKVGALRSPARGVARSEKTGLELGRVKFSCNTKHNLF